MDDIPYQLRVGAELALVMVPGRAPLCLLGRRAGHIHNECRISVCNVCRRFVYKAPSAHGRTRHAMAPVLSDKKSGAAGPFWRRSDRAERQPRQGLRRREREGHRDLPMNDTVGAAVA